ncbi:2-amino-4-hydroxy-6-hydroxymethyldihydropteridinepyrophosphokinase [hydrothermal vent metagenome]|uniref:2-amino-4-hydroxy-6-hydroxymethyldihydropteridine diphosphokinase n=1 Tax=hydrothermal vent metagenome TaxID=652676 RepID=A0A1W1EDK2_9ZZZZ
MLKRKLNKDNSLLITEHYPSVLRSSKIYKHRALLGIGGNIGDTIRRFAHLFIYFKKSKFLQIIESAPILKNPPFGYLEQGDFYNSLLLIETNLSPSNLLKYMLRVEKLYGRKRLFKDGPRTLDIDIIFYENVKMQSKTLTLPHPSWMERSSVLIPLYYMKGQV